jgi:hypothetical protein
MEMLKRKSKVAVVVIVLAITCFYILYKKQERRTYVNAILTNPYLTNGVVSNVQYVYKRGYKIEYSFDYKGQILYNKYYSPLSSKMQSLIIGKYFPVLVNDKNPFENDILIFPDDFKAFNISFPDSLSWVKEYE